LIPKRPAASTVVSGAAVVSRVSVCVLMGLRSGSRRDADTGEDKAARVR
jgi:hypothetical protein